MEPVQIDKITVFLFVRPSFALRVKPSVVRILARFERHVESKHIERSRGHQLLSAVLGRRHLRGRTRRERATAVCGQNEYQQERTRLSIRSISRSHGLMRDHSESRLC